MPYTMEDVKTKLDGIADEVKEPIDRGNEKRAEHSARLLAIERKLAAPGGGPDAADSDLGLKVAQSDGFKALQGGAKSSGEIKIGRFHKTNIINATGLNQPLVQTAWSCIPTRKAKPGARESGKVGSWVPFMQA
jgi:hypothetical protein